jgi:hypothetical protein
MPYALARFSTGTVMIQDFHFAILGSVSIMHRTAFYEASHCREISVKFTKRY